MSVTSRFPRRLGILAQWSADGEPPAHVRIHLERLRPHCDRLVLVSNSHLSSAGRAKAKQLCDSVIERPNVGYDFAAWRDALESEDMTEWNEVLLTNSSLIGPLFGLDSVFSEMAQRRCDFWGLTFSREHTLHIQSYFMVFRRRLIRSDAWICFWRNVTDLSEKRMVIEQQEIRLYDYFVSRAFTGECFIPYHCRAGASRIYMRRLGTRLPLWLPTDRERTNLTITAPLQLIKAGVPYLKAALVWGEAKQIGAPLNRIKELSKVDYPWNEIGL